MEMDQNYFYSAEAYTKQEEDCIQQTLYGLSYKQKQETKSYDGWKHHIKSQ